MEENIPLDDKLSYMYSLKKYIFPFVLDSILRKCKFTQNDDNRGEYYMTISFILNKWE